MNHLGKKTIDLEGTVLIKDDAVTLVGCTDSTYTFKKVDDKTLKGGVAAGREASLVRH